MNSKEELQEIIFLTKKWHDSRINQLKIVLEKSKETNIQFMGKDGKTIELPKEDEDVFLLGIRMAIDLFEDYPVNF